ncbi:hypothetical protein C8R44DRAFT_737200 [Mycena epipterygia]|nr:hypothetical protein C8R44DRAFT_737200 [Mycena epipterygia]
MYHQLASFPEEGISSAPFIPHEILVIIVPAQSLTLESMNDLNALPVLFKNDIQFNVEDGITHVSTYLLNSSYDFVEVVNSLTLPTLYHADIGVKFIAVAPTSMSSLVSFYQHLNMKQLADIAASHRVHVSKTKPELLVSSMTHASHDRCVGVHKVLLFCRSRRFREGVVDQLQFLMEEIHQRENELRQNSTWMI